VRSSGISVSVVVPAFRAAGTLLACVAALLEQDAEFAYEIIVVQSGDDDADFVDLADDERVRAIRQTPRLSSAAARNLGAARARGDAIAFTDADAIADPTWLRTIARAAGDAAVCVAGSVVNGTPQSATGTAEYLVAFLDLHPARPVEGAWHGATCNLFVPLAVWHEYGPFAEDMLGGEDTLFTAALHEHGRFRFCPTARVAHLNRTDPRAVVARQYTYGRWTARAARRGPYHHGRLVRRPALAPVLGLGRLVWVYSRAWRRMRLAPWQLVRTVPVVSAALTAWVAGVAREGVRLDRRRGRVARATASDAARGPAGR